MKDIYTSGLGKKVGKEKRRQKRQMKCQDLEDQGAYKRGILSAAWAKSNS